MMCSGGILMCRAAGGILMCRVEGVSCRGGRCVV